MANQIGVNVYSIAGIPQPSGEAVLVYFPTKQMMVQESFDNPVTNVNSVITFWPNPSQPAKGVLYGIHEEIPAVLATANTNGNSMFQATVEQIDSYPQKQPAQWLFPADKPAIFPHIDDTINSFVWFKGIKYYCQESAQELEEDANPSPLDTEWVTLFSGAFGEAAGLGSGATGYAQITGRSASFAVPEVNVQFVLSEDFIMSNAILHTTTAQSGLGDLVVTLRVNGADTPLSITVPAGSAAGTFTDNTPGHAVAISAGDLVSWGLVNGAAATSAKVQSIGATGVGNN